MSRDLLDRQRYFLGASGLGKNKAVALMHRKAATKVRQCKCALSVATVGRADQLKERLILGNWE
jgi:hypothetical protein